MFLSFPPVQFSGAPSTFPQGNEYTIYVSGNRSTVIETNPSDENCGNDLTSTSNTAADLKATTDLLGSTASADASGAYLSDVVFYYDDATETAANATIQKSGLSQTAEQLITDTIKANIVLANNDLTTSLITNFQWNLVGVFKLPTYDDKGDLSMNTDLIEITSATDTAGTFAAQKAIETGADQQVLYVGAARGYSGLAWRPGHQAVVSWGTSHMTLAHEMSHNLGCYHDRQTESAKDSDGIFAYGYRYTDANGRDTGTIMSYASFRLPYFSNPELAINGVTLGVAADQPKAANNARQIRESASIMASYRSTIEVPKITQQPTGKTVTAGQSFSLSVTATGGNLSYQWYLGNNAISGAISSTYSKASASTADAGSYYVIVTNNKGSAQSDAAVLTVNAASSSGSGGGGGGGAPSLLFYGALALLVGAKRFFGKRSS